MLQVTSEVGGKMLIQYIDGYDFKDKKVLARFDFNVPIDKNGKVQDTTRIDEAISTIKTILDKGPRKLVMMAHLGRPKGKPDKKYSLAPIAGIIAERLGEEVILTESPTDGGIKTLLTLPKTRIILLENLRFNPGEEKNDPELARLLASYGEVYVNDAFGTAHRKHASTYGVVAFFNKGQYLAGHLLKKEIESLSKIYHTPVAPLVALIGGAKVADKISVIENLLPRVQHLLIGGAMAYPFLKAKGHAVGKSLCSQDDINLAKNILLAPTAKKIVLPLDHIVSDSHRGQPSVSGLTISEQNMGLDIGPSTIVEFSRILDSAKTILWNGPMGLFENPNFAKGTVAMAQKIASLKNVFSVVGGGDSVSAIKQFGLAQNISHVSTGGGASLEYLENGSLPCIDALRFGIH